MVEAMGSRLTSLSVRLLVCMLLLLTVEKAWPQQVRYIYDDLNRLIGVVDLQGRTAIYQYDAVGNILAIRREDAVGPVDITFVNPNAGVIGSGVEIFGIGFSPVAAENQIFFNGVSAPVLLASANSLTTQVPPGATSGPIAVTTPLGSAVSPEDFTVLGNVVVSPAEVVLVVRTTRPFTATVTGIADQRVVWSVNGIVGGDGTFGTISPEGRYLAPAAVPVPATVVVRATSVAFPDRFGEANVTIVAEPTGFALSSVSVRFGPPPPGALLARAVSVAKGPVITDLSPANGPRGTTFILTVTGFNFTGATELVFSFQGAAAGGVTATDLNVSPGGDQLTARVTIGPAAPLGPRLVVVKTPASTSTSADTGRNVFTVTP